MIRHHKHTLGALLAAVVLTAGATPAQAAFITGTVASGDLTTVISGGTVVNFESSTVHTFSNEVISSGVRFLRIAGGTLAVGSAGAGTNNTRGDRYLTNLGDGPPSFDFRFDFTAGPVSEFAFLWGGSDRGWDIRVFDINNNLLEQHLGALPLTATGNAGNYAGIRRGTADIAFVTIYNASLDGDVIYLDNLTFNPPVVTPVPVPASAVLFGIGFAGLAGFRSLRRKGNEAPVSAAAG